MKLTSVIFSTMLFCSIKAQRTDQYLQSIVETVDSLKQKSNYKGKEVYVVVIYALDTVDNCIKYSLGAIRNGYEYSSERLNTPYYLLDDKNLILIRYDYFLEKEYGNFLKLKDFPGEDFVLNRLNKGDGIYGAIGLSRALVVKFCDDRNLYKWYEDSGLLPYELDITDWDYLKHLDRVKNYKKQ